jgi:methionyl-tRNA synthetase
LPDLCPSMPSPPPTCPPPQQDIFWQLHGNGLLVEKAMEQLYSEPISKFLADRFVVGTCPKCARLDARGDQCDGCGALLDPTDLLDPKCKVTGGFGACAKHSCKGNS